MIVYPAGTVAEATVRGVPNVRVMASTDCIWWSAEPVYSSFRHVTVTDIRPLVVLDLHAANPNLAPGEAARCVITTLRRSEWFSNSLLADQIEAQTKPPKPEEPKGLGAVVEDSKGVRWVRNPDLAVICKWRNADRDWTRWDLIDAVKVLSEGVQ